MRRWLLLVPALSISCGRAASVEEISGSVRIETPKFEDRISDLPRHGKAAVLPWVGGTWPVHQDSINYKWDGPQSESASTKYARAFGVSGVEDAVSAYYGIDANPQQPACKTKAECQLGETCATREPEPSGATAGPGRCIPTWWNLSRAWTSASLFAPEPRHPVTHNGVTFEVNDIKALLTLLHEGAPRERVSLRCNKKGIIHADRYGRPTTEDDACKDTDAGAYHLLLTNYLGIMKQSFAEDRTFDDEVWSEPVRGYRITEQKKAAPSSIPSTFQFNDKAVKFVHVKSEVDYVTDSSSSGVGTHAFEYILAMGANGKVLQGVWVGESEKRHPDFVWLPAGPATSPVAGGAIDRDVVFALLKRSIADPPASTDGGSSATTPGN